MLEIFPEGVNRVCEFLRLKNSKSIVQMLPESTATAQEAADALGVDLHQIGKSIVLGNEADTIIAIVCGDQKVDTDSLSKAINLSDIKPLKANEVKERVGFVIGGVSPFSLPGGTIIVIDARLHNLAECYVAAGHPKAVIKTSGKEIVDLTGATVSLICVQ